MARLRKEVVVPDGPTSREAVKEYRELRRLVYRATRHANWLRYKSEQGHMIDPLEALDGLEPLIRELRKFL